MENSIDREKVIKGMECCIKSDRTCLCPENCPYADADETHDQCETQVKLSALALLKEHEAFEPTIDEYGNKRCGNCGHKLQSIADMDLFCCKCGRSVKWE